MNFDDQVDLVDYNLVLPNKSLADYAEIYIQDMIIKGFYKNGSRLVESEIAEKLNISRGPVRDALKILEQKGVIDIEPRKGARVCIFSKRDFKEILEIRLLIENSIIENVIEENRLTSEDIYTLQKINDKMIAAAKSDVIYQDRLIIVNEYCVNFHKYIWGKSRSKRRKNILESMYFQLKLAMQYNINNSNDILEYVSKYEEIVDNLRNGHVNDTKEVLKALSNITED